MIKKTPRFHAPHPKQKRYLVVMLRFPAAGRVKTRLARDIGTIPATYFYRHTLHILVRRLAYSRTWTTILAITPDNECESQTFPRSLLRYPQGTGNLGKRIQRIFETFGPNPTVIIGSDIPTITHEDIAKAFHSLAGRQAIIGPSDDGGYWLIGLRRQIRTDKLFHSVPWSTRTTLDETIKNLSKLDLAFLNPLQDIDSQSDYENMKHLIGRNILSPFIKKGVASA